MDIWSGDWDCSLVPCVNIFEWEWKSEGKVAPTTSALILPKADGTTSKMLESPRAHIYRPCFPRWHIWEIIWINRIIVFFSKWHIFYKYGHYIISFMILAQLIRCWKQAFEPFDRRAERKSGFRHLGLNRACSIFLSLTEYGTPEVTD